VTSPLRIGILGTARIAVPALIEAARPVGGGGAGGDTTYTWQLRAFAAAIQRGEPFPTTAANATTTMRLIDDCYLAAGFPLRG
jgi:hypothetical protein